MDPLFLIFCACLFGFILLMGFALHPSSETTSISQRLEGLKAGQQQRVKTSLRDEEEMGKSPFTRIVLPIIDKLSKFFSQMTPVRSEEHTSELQSLRHLVCRL